MKCSFKENVKIFKIYIVNFNGTISNRLKMVLGKLPTPPPPLPENCHSESSHPSNSPLMNLPPENSHSKYSHPCF